MPELDYRALNRRARTELERQKNLARWVFFSVHLGIFFLFLIFGWVFFLSGGAAARQGIAGAGLTMLTVGGALGLMFHFFSAFLSTQAGEAKMRARIMERLMADEVMRLGEEAEELDQEKAKRMSINEEGELEETLSEAEIAAFEERRTQSKR